MQSSFLVFRAHEMRDYVAALGAASAVTKPLIANVALDYVFRFVEAAVAARVHGHFFGVGEEIVILERLLEVQFNCLAGCSKRVNAWAMQNGVNATAERGVGDTGNTPVIPSTSST